MASRAADKAGSPTSRAPGEMGKPFLPVSNPRLLTVGVMLATIMQILDTTIANVALPHMEAALGATADTVTWVLTSYIVASAIAIPTTGWLSDKIGSRNLFLFAIIGFIISSALCGAATSLGEMVAFRFLQGISAAFMNPLSQTVLLDINPRERQAKAMSIWGMGIMIGPILGPVIGGWLTDNYSWRWVFYVNLPVGVLCLAILWPLLPSRPRRKRSFDHMGFALLALGIAALQLLLDRGQSEDWFQSREIWIEAILAGTALWMFIVHLFTGKNPMFDRELFADRNLATALVFMIVIGVVMFATMALLPPMLQQIYGYPVLDTGMLLVPRGVGILVSMGLAGQLVQRGFDARILVIFGLAVAALSLWDMTRWTLAMPTAPIVISGLVQGLGMGLVFIPLQTIAFSTLPDHFRTEASSLLNLFRNIGASVGISVVTTMLARNMQVSHVDLSQHITPQALATFDPYLLRQFGDLGSAAMAAVNAEVTRQAAMIAYLDDFRLMMIVTACAVPLGFLLQKSAKPVNRSAPPMDH